MKKGKVFFHPIEGSGALTISWTSGPKGDAVEAKKGSGVGFFSDKGDLLCVIFDEVQAEQDRQTLEFTRDIIEISVKNSQVTYNIIQRIVEQTTLRKKNHPKRRARPKVKSKMP